MGSSLEIKINRKADREERFSLVLRTFEYDVEREVLFKFNYEMAKKLHDGGVRWDMDQFPTDRELEIDLLEKEKEELQKELLKLDKKLEKLK